MPPESVSYVQSVSPSLVGRCRDWNRAYRSEPGRWAACTGEIDPMQNTYPPHRSETRRNPSRRLPRKSCPVAEDRHSETCASKLLVVTRQAAVRGAGGHPSVVVLSLTRVFDVATREN